MAQPSNANFLTVANNPLLDNPPPTNPVLPCAAGTTYPAFSANMTTTSAYSWCPYYVQLNTTKAGPVEGEVQLLELRQQRHRGKQCLPEWHRTRRSSFGGFFSHR